MLHDPPPVDREPIRTRNVVEALFLRVAWLAGGAMWLTVGAVLVLSLTQTP